MNYELNQQILLLVVFGISVGLFCYVLYKEFWEKKNEKETR